MGLNDLAAGTADASPGPGLRIVDITLRNFRSYGEFSLHEVGDLTVFVGPNASGKTNIVEAVQLLTALVSFRSATASELVKNGESQARAEASLTDGGRLLEVGLHLEAGTEGTAAASGRHYVLNGKRRRTKDLRGMLPSVTFTPDDLNLVKGSDRHRRRELDVLGAQLNANYYQIVRDYEKVLRQKNRLLKEEAPIPLIAAANEVFAKVGEQLAGYREALFKRMVPHIAAHYEGISHGCDRLDAEYVRSWDPSLPLAEAVDLQSEAARRRTLAGPHLDKVRILIDGLDAQSFASQGQQRSVVLAFKLAEAEIVEEMLGQFPVLLLDDVMSELDEARREALVQGLIKGKQTFITTANIDYFDAGMLSRANVVKLG